VDPTFEYENAGQTARYLQEFSMDDDPTLLNIAQKILESFIDVYGSERHFIKLEGRLLTQTETERFFNNYIGRLGLEEFLSLNFTPNAVAPTSITHTST